MSKVTVFNADSSMQRIRAHYLDPEVKISKSEAKQLERMDYLFTIRLGNRYSKETALFKLMDKFGVSKATAYRDYADMEQLFGSIDESKASIEKVFIREGFHRLSTKLEREGKYEAAAKVLKMYEDTFPPEKDDEDYLDLQTKKYILKMDKTLENHLISQLTESPVVDMNKFSFEDIEYKKVDNAKK